MSLRKKIRNATIAALLAYNIVSAPPNYGARYFAHPDIYGKKLKGDYSTKDEDKKEPIIMSEKQIYKMIDLSMGWIGSPEYLDRKYHRIVTWKESTDDSRAKSHANARGLRQLRKIAWKESTDEDYNSTVYNPQANTTVGILYNKEIDRFLSQHHPRWKKLTRQEKIDLNTAANNGGITRLMKSEWDINRMPRETKEYVRKIRELYNRK